MNSVQQSPNKDKKPPILNQDELYYEVTDDLDFDGYVRIVSTRDGSVAKLDAKKLFDDLSPYLSQDRHQLHAKIKEVIEKLPTVFVETLTRQRWENEVTGDKFDEVIPISEVAILKEDLSTAIDKIMEEV